MNHTIVYIMRHIDIGGHIEIPYKKIGITGAGEATLDSRLRQISNTKSPIKAQFVAAWSHDNAKSVEGALHELLEDSQVEGEWFLDKNDTLQDRMERIMSLLGATKIEIAESNDAHTEALKKQETKSKQSLWSQLAVEIGELIDSPLRSSVRLIGPTFFSDKTNLTYYVNARKSGSHQLVLGRGKDRFDELKALLDSEDYDIDTEADGTPRVLNLNNKMVAYVINLIESS